MTLEEANKRYPLIWVVRWYNGLGYHDHEKLFVTESEAKEFYDSLEYAKDRVIGCVHDIWGFSKKHK